MLAVQPGAGHECDKELRSVGVLTGVGHRQQVGLRVLDLEVLVFEFLAIDRLASSAVALGEVTSLSHEVSDDSVESASLVAVAGFASAEGSEVFCGFGDDVVVEFEDNSTSILTANADIEENSGSDHDFNI